MNLKLSVVSISRSTRAAGQSMNSSISPSVLRGVKSGRQLQIEHIQHIVAKARLPLHHIGHGAGGAGLRRELLGNGGFLGAFLDQVLVDAQAIGLAAGHQVIQLARRDRFILRPPADPEMQSVGLAHETVHMHAARLHAESRNGDAVDLEQRRPAELRHDGKILAPQFSEDSGLDQPRADLRHRAAARVEIRERGLQPNRPVIDRKDIVIAGQSPRQFMAHPADLRFARHERAKARHVPALTQADMIQQAHAITNRARPDSVPPPAVPPGPHSPDRPRTGGRGASGSRPAAAPHRTENRRCSRGGAAPLRPT